MNREIKFRAWDPQDECMFYQEDCYESDEFAFSFTPNGIELSVIDERWESGSGEWESSEYFRIVGNAKFMQFTGMKDKNGVDIYESDIVSITTIDNFTHEAIKISNQVVTYNEKTARFDNASHFCDVSVIGNIHQNPELIEGK